MQFKKLDRKTDPLKSLGICLGASTISMVHLKQALYAKGQAGTSAPQKPYIVKYTLHPHEGDPKKTLRFAIQDLDLNSFDRIAATGRKFRYFVNLFRSCFNSHYIW